MFVSRSCSKTFSSIYVSLCRLGVLSLFLWLLTSCADRSEEFDVVASVSRVHNEPGRFQTDIKIRPASDYWVTTTHFVCNNYTDWTWVGGGEGFARDAFKGNCQIPETQRASKKTLVVVIEVFKDSERSQAGKLHDEIYRVHLDDIDPAN